MKAAIVKKYRLIIKTMGYVGWALFWLLLALGWLAAMALTPSLQLRETALDAQAQFVEKHRPLMNERNLHNQAFYRRTMQQEPLSLAELIGSMRYGLVETKVRYYLKHKMQWLIKVRKQLLSKGIKGLFGPK